MSDTVKIALIAAFVAVMGGGAYIYFSPYQTCIRSFMEMSERLNGLDVDQTMVKMVAEQKCASG
jgi:hypothetical protein